jgi:recombination protein RecA
MAKIKNQGLEAIIANIEKQCGGTGVIQKFGDIPKTSGWDTILSFGYPDVDEASNCGGIARGKVIEIFGQESGGKSFLSLKLIASAQKQDLACCLVDAENSFDSKWAEKHGVDSENLYIIKCTERIKGVDLPMSAERILDYVAAICSNGGFGLVVIDSTAALIPQKELEGSVGDQDYALLARAMSKALRKIVVGCGATKTTCVFLNQIREKMGVVFGNPETTPGGRALRFYSHQRIAVTPGSVTKVKDGLKEKIVSRKSTVRFVKNKVAAPMGSCTIEIVFDEASLNPLVTLCNAAKDMKLVGMREGIWQIKKTVTGDKKNIDTGTSTIVQLADYLVKNNLVNKIIEAYISAKEQEDEKVEKSIQAIIDEFEKNPNSMVSPLEGKSVSIEKEKTDEKLMEEMQAEGSDKDILDSEE